MYIISILLKSDIHRPYRDTCHGYMILWFTLWSMNRCNLCHTQFGHRQSIDENAYSSRSNLYYIFDFILWAVRISFKRLLFYIININIMLWYVNRSFIFFFNWNKPQDLGQLWVLKISQLHVDAALHTAFNLDRVTD